MLNASRKALAAGLLAVLTTIGFSTAHAVNPTTEAFAATDTNADGVIDVEEYRARMLTVFAVLDKDGDGFLVVAEVPDGHKELFPVVDKDGSGKVGVREYLVFLVPRFWQSDYDGDTVLSLPEAIAADKFQGVE